MLMISCCTKLWDLGAGVGIVFYSSLLGIPVTSVDSRCYFGNRTYRYPPGAYERVRR